MGKIAHSNICQEYPNAHRTENRDIRKQKGMTKGGVFRKELMLFTTSKKYGAGGP